MGDLPPILLMLTLVTGVVDAVSFLGLGHIFTANMTPPDASIERQYGRASDATSAGPRSRPGVTTRWSAKVSPELRVKSDPGGPVRARVWAGVTPANAASVPPASQIEACPNRVPTRPDARPSRSGQRSKAAGMRREAIQALVEAEVKSPQAFGLSQSLWTECRR
jgi:hypothetical protein